VAPIKATSPGIKWMAGENYSIHQVIWLMKAIGRITNSKAMGNYTTKTPFISTYLTTQTSTNCNKRAQMRVIGSTTKGT
jgi:hypothetical protein